MYEYLPCGSEVQSDRKLLLLLLVVVVIVVVVVAARSKAWVCGRSLAGISGSNPARGMDVCLL
jgi:hypothetical protein